MKSFKTESCVFSNVLDENLMEQLNGIQPKAASSPQEEGLHFSGCDGSCSGCSSCQGIN